MDKKKEDTHIQKIVPLPPIIIDKAIPEIEPTPIFPARERFKIFTLFLVK